MATPIGNQKVERELLSEDCLRRWVPLTLEQRCIRIK